MRRLALAAVLSILTLAGCTQATAPASLPLPSVAATQTPWIVIITATPGPLSVTEPAMTPEPPTTQTPWIIVVIATPTPTPAAPTGTQPESAATTQPESAATTQPESAAATQPASTPASTAATMQPGVTSTSQATPSPRPVLPTATATRKAYQFKPLVLLEPPSGVIYGWKSTVFMEWEPVGALAADEYYALHLEAYRESDGAFWYGDYVLTKVTSYRAEGAFLAPFHPSASNGRAVVYWWVTVVKKTGESGTGKPVGVDISSPSDKRFFIVEPKP